MTPREQVDAIELLRAWLELHSADLRLVEPADLPAATALAESAEVQDLRRRTLAFLEHTPG